jgi:hypothetical protein
MDQVLSRSIQPENVRTADDDGDEGFDDKCGAHRGYERHGRGIKTAREPGERRA